MPKPDGVGVTGGSGAKSVFLTQDDEGNEMLCSVEEFVREHYKKEENYPEGLHAGLVTNSIFSVYFLVKAIIDLSGGQINDPSAGKHNSLTFLTTTPSSPSPTLRADMAPFKGPRLASCVASRTTEIRGQPHCVLR